MKWIFSLLFSLVSLCGISQKLSPIVDLHDDIKESSGLIYLNHKIITHNDSGGEAALYEIDSILGTVSRKVILQNAQNKDWEDLCYDDTYIYIADIGNNNGTRTDLRIYRIAIADYINTSTDTLSADTIQFSYSDQSSFTSSQYTTNFDAEAIVSWNDSLYIFTKNWGNMRCNIYAVPKTPGSYSISKMDSFDSQGMITGASYDSSNGTILLCGYGILNPFAVKLDNFHSNVFSNGTIIRSKLQMPSGYSYQIESITTTGNSEHLLTSEGSFSGKAGLYRLNSQTMNIDLIEHLQEYIYPNPATERVSIQAKDFSYVEVYDTRGTLLKISSKKQVDITGLKSGTYIFIVKDKNDKKIFRKRVIVQSKL